jgi:putative acetyltransferase
VSGSADTLALLGPVAVAPDWQRRGVGKALIQAGVERLRQAPVAAICVLGDPGYYGPLGFAPERAIAPPFPLPEGWREAWQSLFLNRAAGVPAGQLRVPAAWRDPALWGA